MSAKEIAAIKVQNEKGEDTVAKVKVKRYFSGKAPELPQKAQDDEADDLFAARNARLARAREANQLPTGSSSNPAVEGIDKKLQRLRESRDSGTRSREIHEGEVVSSRQARHPSPERKAPTPEPPKSESEEEDDEEIDRRRARLREMAKKKREEETELLAAQQEQEEEEEEEEESEYETDSEEEEFPTRTLAKPVFIPKHERKTIEEREKLLKEEAEIQMKNAAKLEERKLETQHLVAEEVRKGIEGVPQEEKVNAVTDVDDTDVPNDQEEYEKWKLRELMRIKRDRERRLAEEKEREDIERRRRMTDKEIMEENKSIPEKQKKEGSKYKFLQKYFHKGAFYQEEEILKRDFNQPTLEDKFNKDLMPKAMQVKDFGFAGRSKYTHLQDQDTSKPDAGWSQKNAINMRIQSKLGGFANSFEKPTARKRKSGD